MLTSCIGYGESSRQWKIAVQGTWGKVGHETKWSVYNPLPFVNMMLWLYASRKCTLYPSPFVNTWQVEQKPGGREWATLGVHPLSWLLSNNRLKKAPFVSVPHTSSNRLLLSNQDKGCTPSVAHSLALPLGPALLNLWIVLWAWGQLLRQRCHTHKQNPLALVQGSQILSNCTHHRLSWLDKGSGLRDPLHRPLPRTQSQGPHANTLRGLFHGPPSQNVVTGNWASSKPPVNMRARRHTLKSKPPRMHNADDKGVNDVKTRGLHCRSNLFLSL